MEKIKVKVMNHESLVLPQYMTSQSAGFDLIARGLRQIYKGAKELDMNLFSYSIEQGYFVLRPQERALIGTGLFIELPEGKQLEIRSRSGIALKRGLIVGNSPGTIDPDYRGEVCVLLVNTTNFLARINFGDAVAQGVVTDCYQVEWETVDSLSYTERGSGAFGHTSFLKPETSGVVNVLEKDTFFSETDVHEGTYLVTGMAAIVFPESYMVTGSTPYDGRRTNRITIFSDKKIKNEYVK
jgi:dUTP pyrophosphatase